MTIVIVSILLLGCLLIATENITKVNRAAVAIFAGTVGWVLYICFGMDFVTGQHAYEFSSYLHSQTTAIPESSATVKAFISRFIFLPYVGRAAEITKVTTESVHIIRLLLRVRSNWRIKSKQPLLLRISTIVIVANKNKTISAALPT